MTKGKRDPGWQNKVLEWQASGKKSLAWCKENHIPYTTFLGWKQRFNNIRKYSQIRSPKGFTELKDQSTSNARICSGVTLEYQGITIHLKTGFNTVVLKQCLACLGGISC